MRDASHDIGNIDAEAPVELDARGLDVAPGFIDVHSHSDYTLLVDPRAVSAIHQGVTTEVIGNCGHGCFPIRNPDLSSRIIYGYDGTVPLDWGTPAAYLERLERGRARRQRHDPGAQRPASPGHRRARFAPRERTTRSSAMTRLLEEGLEAGAWGYSTGLEYATEQGAREPEITTLARATARRGGFYATHTREREQFADEAVAEAIRTARNAGRQAPDLTPGAPQRRAIRPTAASTSWMPPGRPATTSPSTCTPGSTA